MSPDSNGSLKGKITAMIARRKFLHVADLCHGISGSPTVLNIGDKDPVVVVHVLPQMLPYFIWRTIVSKDLD